MVLLNWPCVFMTLCDPCTVIGKISHVSGAETVIVSFPAYDGFLEKLSSALSAQASANARLLSLASELKTLKRLKYIERLNAEVITIIKKTMRSADVIAI